MQPAVSVPLTKVPAVANQASLKVHSTLVNVCGHGMPYCVRHCITKLAAMMGPRGSNLCRRHIAHGTVVETQAGVIMVCYAALERDDSELWLVTLVQWRENPLHGFAKVRPHLL